MAELLKLAMGAGFSVWHAYWNYSLGFS